MPIVPEVTSFPEESVTFNVYPLGALIFDLKVDTDVLKSTPVIYCPILYFELSGLTVEDVSLATVILYFLVSPLDAVTVTVTLVTSPVSVIFPVPETLAPESWQLPKHLYTTCLPVLPVHILTCTY